LIYTMKTTISLGLALLAMGSAQAQIFRSEAVRGAVLGGIAGGVIGHNSGDLRHNGWRGAAIGATAGLLIGQAIGDARAHRDAGRYGRPHGDYIYRSSPSIRVGVGYSHWRSGPFGFHGHRYPGHSRYGWQISYAPRFGYHRGYGLGYPHIGYGDYVDAVYGSSAPVVLGAPQPLVVQAAPAPDQPAAAPQQVTIINNYYNSPSPMSSANGLFGR
jgi:hypothetical protein